MKQFKIIFCALFVGFFGGIAVCNAAPATRYYEPTMDNLTRMLFNFGVLDLSDPSAFSEFMKVNFCDIYRSYAKSEFDWNEIHQAFWSRRDMLKDNRFLDYKINTVFEIDGYDFNVQAFNIAEGTAIKDVRALQMNADEYSFCETSSNIITQLRDIPNDVLLNIELPLNLYRIPLGPDIAEKIMKQFDHTRHGSALVYATIFVHVETGKKISEEDNENRKRRRKALGPINVYGYIDKITFYSDSNHRHPFKTLYYNY